MKRLLKVAELVEGENFYYKIEKIGEQNVITIVSINSETQEEVGDIGFISWKEKEEVNPFDESQVFCEIHVFFIYTSTEYRNTNVVRERTTEPDIFYKLIDKFLEVSLNPAIEKYGNQNVMISADIVNDRLQNIVKKKINRATGVSLLQTYMENQFEEKIFKARDVDYLINLAKSHPSAILKFVYMSHPENVNKIASLLKETNNLNEEIKSLFLGILNNNQAFSVFFENNELSSV